MKILFVTDNFYPETNAPASRTFEHARTWVESGHSVTVLTTAPNFPEGKLYAGYHNRWWQRQNVYGIDVVRVKTYMTANEGFVKRTLDYVSFMMAAIIASPLLPRCDVVIGTSPQFFAALGARIIAGLRRRPFVLELRDLWPASIVAVGALRSGVAIKMLEALELYLYRSAAAIISVTHSFRRELAERGIDADKIEVVQNGVDLTHFTPGPRDLQLVQELGLSGRFVVGYLGTLGMAHGLHNVLQAAARLRHRTDITFIMVGAGAEKRSLEAHAAQLALHNVSFVARQPKERMPALLGLCDLCLVPLRDLALFRSVLPSKIFEAMAMHTPILAALPRGEASELVELLGTGEIVAPEDPAALAEAVVRLAGDPARLNHYRSNAARVAVAYDRRRLAQKMIDAIAQRIGQREP
ncbi:Colanic acid biosynthesis glycosyl transferase WcaI [Paraburkholderia piptadeniae]|uniref:Glycosyltransferase n=2 Tax=Paraburkholderia TaxID=1822464 RepID=A0A7X1TGU9_9BURK|nr:MULTISPECIES: glycosyltransferase family 4 protein [Paraburkholderia]MPW18748.1 glycosyltransferase [Paraburkholderia franconis]SIT48251.1 Colanic acid biosynthesis glycosyl transferase WcaI [Paraburkholderia piptadeniae]